MRDAYGMSGDYYGLRFALSLYNSLRFLDRVPFTTIRAPNGRLGQKLLEIMGPRFEYQDE